MARKRLGRRKVAKKIQVSARLDPDFYEKVRKKLEEFGWAWRDLIEEAGHQVMIGMLKR